MITLLQRNGKYQQVLRWFVIGPGSPDIIRELGFSISLIFSGWILIFGESAWWVGHLIKILKTRNTQTSKSSASPTTTTTNTKCLQAEKATSSPALENQNCATAGFSLPEKKSTLLTLVAAKLSLLNQNNFIVILCNLCW